MWFMAVLSLSLSPPAAQCVLCVKHNVFREERVKAKKRAEPDINNWTSIT